MAQDVMRPSNRSIAIRAGGASGIQLPTAVSSRTGAVNLSPGHTKYADRHYKG